VQCRSWSIQAGSSRLGLPSRLAAFFLFDPLKEAAHEKTTKHPPANSTDPGMPLRGDRRISWRTKKETEFLP
jgi:hypothetical protein